MRIAYLIHHVSGRAAGVMEVVQAQARELGSRDHTVAVFGYRHPLDSDATPKLGELDLRATGTWLGLAQGYSPRLERSIADFRPDILHTHGIWTGLSLSSLRAQTMTGAPLVISPHGMLDPWATRHKSWKKRLASALFERRHLARAKLIHVLTPAEHTDVEQLGLPARLVVVPNGVLPPPVGASDGGVPFGPSTRSRVLLFLGRIHRKKGVFELVDAFERQADTLAGWRLVIAGFGEAEDERRLRRRLQTATATEFIGRQGPKARHACYAAATAFVLPSHSEGLPMTVLEAWSHQKLALISPACHLDRGCEVGAALPITPDPAGLDEGLRRLASLSDQELADRGQAAGELVRTEFSWGHIGAALESEYQRLLIA